MRAQLKATWECDFHSTFLEDTRPQLHSLHVSQSICNLPNAVFQYPGQEFRDLLVYDQICTIWTQSQIGNKMSTFT